MSENVSVKVKIEDDGSIKTVTVNAQEFAEALDKVKKSTIDLKNEKINFAAFAAGLEAISNQFNQFGQVLGDLSATYAAQIEAETKLEQVMQNTMNATAADVQVIKELCSAQQELGVIGDEVQLAGAQELATYLEKRSSLEALIPVMNDMVAQQYGYNATQESAAQIATMMGKVMEGQVSALSRYGYSFTDAQAEILKFGTEEERAATLAEVVGQSVGGVNQALAKTPYGKFKQMANSLGDLKEQLGAAAAKIQPFYTGLNSAVQTGAGITTVVTGTKAFKDTITACTGAVGKLSKATKAFFVSNPLLLALTAVAAIAVTVAAALRDDGKASEELKAQTEAYDNAVADATAKMNEEIAGLRQLMDSHKDTTAAVNRLNETYGDTFGTFQTAEEWYDRLIDKSKEYALVMGLEARAKVISQQLSEKMMQKYDAEQKAAQAKEKDGGERRKKVMSYTPNGMITQTVATEYGYAMDMAEKYGAEADKLSNDLNNLYSTINDVKESLKGNGGAADETAESYNTVCEAIQEQEKLLRNYSKSQTDSIEKTKAEIAELKRKKAEYEKLLGIGSTDKPATTSATAPKGSLRYVEEQIKTKKEVYDLAIDPEARAKVKRELDELETQKRIIELQVEANLAGFSSATSYVSSMIDQWLEEDLELEIKLDEEALGEIEDIPETLKTVQKQVRKTGKVAGESFTAIGELGGNLSEVMKAWTGDTENAAAAWLEYGASVAQSMSQVIAAIVAGIAAKDADTQSSNKNTTSKVANAASGFFASFSEIPIVGIILALAAVAGMVATMLSLPKFAKGGIAFGPTVGMFGEYPGAANNPEVVAPLSRLKSLLGDSGNGGGEVEFRIKGRRLVGVLAKEGNVMARR